LNIRAVQLARKQSQYRLRLSQDSIQKLHQREREREIESFSVGNSTNRWQIIGRADDTGKLDMRWRLIGTFYQETTRLVIIH